MRSSVPRSVDDPLVSGVQERWAERGLPGTPWPFMAMCSVARLHHLLTKALEAELERLDLGRTGYFLLTMLALTAEGRARLGTLSRLMMIHPTTVKLAVDQLEAAGLVSRRPHPTDRRATLVFITETGRERAAAANRALESPDGALGAFAGRHREIFEALQPARLAAGDAEMVQDDMNRT
ncbi:MarR family winged helix-turn-helix transcriptional regulator [Actinomadura rubrobrunea]|uniref:MarR family winged helix-turn-helix transcriptional regulator n=1 Tax=Actinomadura rubrobrunea TaxID=115335 RepID=UPI000831C8C2|nr:MarR family transcriptional regulator [Actinomadura rubrobrunea]